MSVALRQVHRVGHRARPYSILESKPLDGELWIDRKKFQRTVSIVRRQDQNDLWREVSFVVFDAPALEKGFEARLEFVRECLADDF